MTDYRSKLIKGTAYMLLPSIISIPLRIVRSAIVARCLGPEILGALSVLRGLQGLCIMVAALGFPLALLKMMGKYKVQNKEKNTEVFSSIIWIMVISTLTLSLILVLFSGFLSVNVYNEPDLQLYIILISLSLIVFVLSGSLRTIFQVYHEIKKLAYLGIVISILEFLLVILLVYYFKLFGVIVAGILGAILSILLFLMYIRKIFTREKISLKIMINKGIIKEGFKTSLPNFMQSTLDTGSIYLIRSIFIIFLSFQAVGYFYIGEALSSFLLFIPLAVATPYFPIINDLYSSSQSDKYSKVIGKTLKVVCFLTLPLALGIALFSNFIIGILYGAAYSPAIDMVFWMAMAGFFVAFGSILGYIFYVEERGHKLVIIRLIWLITFLISSYFFIQYFSHLGIALGFFTSYLLQSFLIIMSLPNLKLNRMKISAFLFGFAAFTPLLFSMWLYLERSYLFSMLLVVSIILIEYKILSEDEKKMILDIIYAFSKKIKLNRRM